MQSKEKLNDLKDTWYCGHCQINLFLEDLEVNEYDEHICPYCFRYVEPLFDEGLIEEIVSPEAFQTDGISR